MDEDGYVSAADKAAEWGLSVRRVRYLCSKYLVFRAFLNACVSRAVRRSAACGCLASLGCARLGIGPVIDFCPICLVK